MAIRNSIVGIFSIAIVLILSGVNFETSAQASNLSAGTQVFQPGVIILQQDGDSGPRLISVPAGQEQAYVDYYRTQSTTRFAELNHKRKVQWQSVKVLRSRFSALGFSQIAQYPSIATHVKRIDADRAHAAGFDCNSTTKIAVVDSGITHPDLTPYLDPGRRFSAGVESTDTSDGNGHGTHVAGIIISNAKCRLVPVGVLDRFGNGYDFDIANGISWAVTQGVNIINLSLGSSDDSTAVRNAVTTAQNNNIVVVAASGNENAQGAVYPAAYTNVVSVGATTFYDEPADFSNWGNAVTVSAPGDGIISTYPPNQYGQASGTSMSTGMVSGCLGLAAATGLSGQALLDRLYQSTEDISYIATNGSYKRVGPRINCAKMVGLTSSSPILVNAQLIPNTVSYDWHGGTADVSVISRYAIPQIQRYSWIGDYISGDVGTPTYSSMSLCGVDTYCATGLVFPTNTDDFQMWNHDIRIVAQNANGSSETFSWYVFVRKSDGADNTATPTVTRTPTSTPTATVTPSTTITVTVTPTMTVTPTVVLTPTPTATRTVTPAVVVSFTRTPTPQTHSVNAIFLPINAKNLKGGW